MFNVQKITEQHQSKIEWLFLAWLITIPIESEIASFSIGFMTVYPSLLLSILLFPFALITVKKWDKLFKVFFLILILLLFFSIIWVFFHPINNDWLVDFRSLSMHTIFSLILFGLFKLFGQSIFLRILKKGVLFYLFILIITGVIEYYTGIHLKGSFTDALDLVGGSTKIFYSPLYIYDNANTFLVYISILSTIYFSILKLTNRVVNQWFFVSLFLVIFIFADSADSKIAMFVSLGAMFLLILSVMNLKEVNYKKYIGYILVFTLFFTLIIVNSDLYLGPKYSLQKEIEQGGNFKEGVINEEGLVYDEIQEQFLPKLSSTTVRKNLILNGFEMMKEQPVLGVGPGQFRKVHENGAMKYNTGTVRSPHNYIIELLAQYGVFGWFYVLFFLYLFILQFKNFIKIKKHFWLLTLLPTYLLFSISPSGFLILDINWIFVTLIIIFTVIVLTNKEESNARN